MPTHASSSSAATATGLLLASAIALGAAVQIADGFYAPSALALVCAALLLCGAGLWMKPAVVDGSHSALRVLLAAGVAGQMMALFSATPGMYLRPDASIEVFQAAIVVQALLVAAGVVGIRAVRRVWFPAVLVVSLFLGVWMLNASPNPKIDVVEVHESALRALGRGRNPYRITFRNIYGDARFYNAAAVSGDRVLFGYPYPPLSLLLAAPGRLIFKDYRYAELAAVVGSAALMAAAGGSLVAQLAGVLWLTTPRLYFVLEQGWTEPIAVLMLALTAFAMARRPQWAAWCAGLLVVTKQYVALAAPFLWRFGLRHDGGPWRFALRSLVAGSLVTLPFVLWNVQAFIDTVVLLQTKEPFRIDSLSFVSWAARAGWGEASYRWAVASAFVAVVLALWRAPNTAAGVCASIAFSTLAMFSMGSKAFCNYYVFVIGALCCSIATGASEQLDTNRRSPQTK